MAGIVIDQLATGEFGVSRTQLNNYEKVQCKCWRTDKHINTVQGRGMQFPRHPETISGLHNDFDNTRRIWFSNSEADLHNPGMLEGALANSERIAKIVLNKYAKESMA